MPKIAIVLADGYADWECAYINGIGGAYYGIETVKLTPQASTVTSMGGIQTIADEGLESFSSDGFDALVICGGTIWETEKAPDIEFLIMNFVDAGKAVAGICGGTLALAKAGILNDKQHTSNTLDFLTGNVDNYSGQIHYVDEVKAVADQNIITAAGNAPAQFSAAVFRAVGVDEAIVAEFLAMLSAEHSSL